MGVKRRIQEKSKWKKVKTTERKKVWKKEHEKNSEKERSKVKKKIKVK